MQNDNALAQLSTIGTAKVLARLIYAEIVHTRDAYTANYDAPDGIRLRERNETVHCLSGVLMAVLGERMSADHHDHMVGLIELTVSHSQHRREERARRTEDQRRIVRRSDRKQFPLI